MKDRVHASLVLSSALVCVSLAAQAQQAGAQQAAIPPTTSNAPTSATAAKKADSVGLEEVVVTARARPSTKLRTSISVTSLDQAAIAQSAPSSAAEILRNVPGIRAESSGGEGNANIAVRGLPVATGGSKYAQFQEDGLPILEFGDIDFATADTFLRADANIDRLEVVRGGSASTFTSNAPGAVFNFISKTGEVAGGSISTEQGLDFDQHRYDFDYGAPLGEGWRFHIGGFYRYGEGPRTADFQDQNGGQIKANVTKTFDRGFVQINVKYLNDTSPAYLPVPLLITGSPGSPHISSLPNFSLTSGTLLSPNFRNDVFFDHNGSRSSINLDSGYRSLDRAIGGEVNYDLFDGLVFDDKFRAAKIGGDFVGIYPAEANPLTTLANEIGGPRATIRQATGPLAGTTIVDPAGLQGNGIGVRDTLFNTTLNNLNNVTNDAKLAKSISFDAYGKFDFALGYYHSTQDIVEDWHWNSYLESAAGKDAILLDVYDAAGKPVTQHGLIGYNAGFGNVARYYDLRYDTDAPYVSATWQRGPVNFDASFRYDFAAADGTYTGATATVFPTLDPAIPTLGGYLVNPSTAAPVHYTKSYLSYSLGLNYLIDPGLAVFVRGSQGGRANAERILFGGGVQPDGGVSQDVAIDLVQQIEGGVKYRNQYGSLFATAFYAHTAETNFDITNRINPLVSATYEAEGLEVQSSLHYGDFRIALGGTYTHSRIVADQISAADVGNVPQRQAEFVWQITPGYYADIYNAGINIIGTTNSYADDANTLVMPGFTSVNVFANYYVRPNIQLSLNINNLFDTVGLTEIDSLPNTRGLATARSIDGRTIKAGLRYTF